jgi:hypothetical protein
MPRKNRDIVFARQEKVFRLRTEESMTFKAIWERVGVCERQVREDFKEAKKRRLQATPELDEWLAEREACLEQLREVAWEESSTS